MNLAQGQSLVTAIRLWKIPVYFSMHDPCEFIIYNHSNTYSNSIHLLLFAITTLIACFVAFVALHVQSGEGML